MFRRRLAKKKIIVGLLVIVLSNVGFANKPGTFTQAKKQVYQLFNGSRITLYCHCAYSYHKQVNLASCGMFAAERFKRSHRTEIEHMMPAESLGRQLRCWQEPLCIKKNGRRYKGRQCCEKISQRFRDMASELYNLWPAVGFINQQRSNYRYSTLATPGTPMATYYGCPIVINRVLRKVEPADYAKGIVARANLFMSEHYGIKLSPSQQSLFKVWNKQFPPALWEKTWAKKVEQIEGYKNPYIG